MSEPLLPRPNRRLLEKLREHGDEVATAAVVWHELLFGLRRLPASARRSAIEEYLNEVVAASVRILPYDDRAADWHAAERSRLTGIGRTPPFADGQIAAVATTNGLTLITANPAAFAAFQDLEVENWRG